MDQFQHGGNQQFGFLDFSVNINPLGMPENVKRIFAGNIKKFIEYPDPKCTELIQELSKYENFPAQNIVCRNGAADLIYFLVYAMF